MRKFCSQELSVGGVRVERSTCTHFCRDTYVRLAAKPTGQCEREVVPFQAGHHGVTSRLCYIAAHVSSNLSDGQLPAYKAEGTLSHPGAAWIE